MKKEINFKEIVHLIFVPQDNPFAKISDEKGSNMRQPEVIYEVSGWNYLNIALATTPKQLKDRIESLREDDLVILWVHVRKHEKDSKGFPKNLEWSQRLKGSRDKREKILNKDVRVYFFTSAHIEDVQGKFLPDKKLGKDSNGEEVYSSNIFYEENLSQMPDPVPAGELLWAEWAPVEHLRPLCPENDWRLRDLMNAVGGRRLREIVRAIMPAQYNQFEYDVLKPGFSNSFILKIICLSEKERDGSYYVLKISKNKKDIEAEHGMSDPKFRKLPSSKFLLAETGNNEDRLYGWHCLRSEFGKDKIPIWKYLSTHLHEEDLTKVLKKTLKRFSSFDRYLNKQPNGAIAIYDNHLPPLTGGKIPPDTHYRGLMLSLKHQTAIFQTLDLFANRYLQKLRELNITVSEHPLWEFVNGNNQVVHAIEVISAGQPTPLKHVHGDFNTANILVNEKDGGKAVFIDFANVSTDPCDHAFLDLGKLSADLDISVVPDRLLAENLNALTDWITCHYHWLHGKAMTPAFPVFEKIGRLQEFLLAMLIETHKDFMKEVEIRRQFQMVRLHYFLKAIGYNYEMPEKIMFFMRASMDIVDYLKNEHPPTSS